MFKFVYWSLYGRKTYCEIHWFPISIVVVPHFHGRGSPVFHPTFLIIVLLIIREFRGYCIYPIILIPFVIGLPPLFPPCIHDLSSLSLFYFFFFRVHIFGVWLLIFLLFVVTSSFFFLFLILRLMILITYLFILKFLLSSIYIFYCCHPCLLYFPLDFPFSLSWQCVLFI